MNPVENLKELQKMDILKGSLHKSVSKFLFIIKVSGCE